jgi:acetyltransferase-like isoleucine patch superfamily enzyme
MPIVVSMPLSKEHRTSLLARLRADLWLWVHRLGGHAIAWGDKPFFFEEGWPVLRAREGTIKLGNFCRLRGGPTRSRLITRDGGRIVIGESSGINFGAEITATQLIEIGDHAAIGPNVTIYDTNFHAVSEGEAVKTAPVKIGDNVWVGRHVMILPGVTVGDHSVIASGAVVLRDIPPRTLVAGNPAKPVREVDASDGWQRL